MMTSYRARATAYPTKRTFVKGDFTIKMKSPPVKLGLVSQNKVYHIYPTQQSVKNGPPNRVPSRITNYHCQSAAKCDTCLYCFFDSFSFLFIHVYVSSPKFRFIELTRAKYTTNANDIQPSFIGVDSTGYTETSIIPKSPWKADKAWLLAEIFGITFYWILYSRKQKMPPRHRNSV